MSDRTDDARETFINEVAELVANARQAGVTIDELESDFAGMMSLQPRTYRVIFRDGFSGDEGEIGTYGSQVQARAAVSATWRDAAEASDTVDPYVTWDADLLSAFGTYRVSYGGRSRTFRAEYEITEV